MQWIFHLLSILGAICSVDAFDALRLDMKFAFSEQKLLSRTINLCALILIEEWMIHSI